MESSQLSNHKNINQSWTDDKIVVRGVFVYLMTGVFNFFKFQEFVVTLPAILLIVPVWSILFAFRSRSSWLAVPMLLVPVFHWQPVLQDKIPNLIEVVYLSCLVMYMIWAVTLIVKSNVKGRWIPFVAVACMWLTLIPVDSIWIFLIAILPGVFLFYFYFLNKNEESQVLSLRMSLLIIGSLVLELITLLSTWVIS